MGHESRFGVLCGASLSLEGLRLMVEKQGYLVQSGGGGGGGEGRSR